MKIFPLFLWTLLSTSLTLLVMDPLFHPLLFPLTTPAFQREMQILAVDEAAVYSPPSQLHLPGDRSTNSDSALSLQEDSDMSSSASSSPSYSQGGGGGADSGDTQVWRRNRSKFYIQRCQIFR